MLEAKRVRVTLCLLWRPSHPCRGPSREANNQTEKQQQTEQGVERWYGQMGVQAACVLFCCQCLCMSGVQGCDAGSQHEIMLVPTDGEGVMPSNLDEDV